MFLIPHRFPTRHPVQRDSITTPPRPPADSALFDRSHHIPYHIRSFLFDLSPLTPSESSEEVATAPEHSDSIAGCECLIAVRPPGPTRPSTTTRRHQNCCTRTGQMFWRPPVLNCLPQSAGGTVQFIPPDSFDSVRERDGMFHISLQSICGKLMFPVSHRAAAALVHGDGRGRASTNAAAFPSSHLQRGASVSHFRQWEFKNVI